VGRVVAERAAAVLRLGGLVVLECGDGQGDGLAGELRDLGYEAVVESSDLAGRDRVVEGTWPGR